MLDHAVERAARAAAAKQEFFDPAIIAIADEYRAALVKLAATEPWETGKISKLAVALRVIEKVEEHIGAVIASGIVADAANARALEIERIPEVKRNMLQRMGMIT